MIHNLLYVFKMTLCHVHVHEPTLHSMCNDVSELRNSFRVIYWALVIYLENLTNFTTQAAEHERINGIHLTKSW